MTSAFLVESIVLVGQKLARDNRYDLFTASDSMNSLIGMILSCTSKAPVGVLGNAEEIIRHAGLCPFESFFARYFYLLHQLRMYSCTRICDNRSYHWSVYPSHASWI